MKHTESGKKNLKSKSSLVKRDGLTPRSGLGNLRVTSPRVKFVVCVKSGGYVDLEPLKVYKVRRDAVANSEGLIRVVDMSGDDYLYPLDFFCAIQAPLSLFKKNEL